MKRIEIIIPHGKLADVYDILKDVNAGGMSYYRIEGSGKIKADPVTVGRGTTQTRPEYISRTKERQLLNTNKLKN